MATPQSAKAQIAKPLARSEIRIRALLSLVSVVLCLILAEYFLLPSFILKQANRQLLLLGLFAPPNSRVDDTSINSQGFTGDVVNEVKPAGTVRILTLGGSAIFNRRMTERIIAAFRAATSQHIEVVGGALRTHSSRDSLIKYEQYFSKYHFDYVLIYDGINDLWMNHVSATKFADDYSHWSSWDKRNLLLNHSLIARYVYNLFWIPKQQMFPKENINGAQFRSYLTFETNIRQLIQDIRTDQGVPVLMTFAWNIPNNYSKDAFDRGTLGFNNPTNYDKWPVELWGPVDYVREGMHHNNSIIRKVAREEAVPLLDQQGRLGGDISNFGDIVHLSEEGTDHFIANIIEFFKTNKFIAAHSRL
jgi:lysophospholipase L1-like esterase